jgi:hypothetical protein
MIQIGDIIMFDMFDDGIRVYGIVIKQLKKYDDWYTVECFNGIVGNYHMTNLIKVSQ